MDIRDSQRIKQIRDNTEKMADAFTRIADAFERLTEPKAEPQTCKNRECENYDAINDHCMFIEQCHKSKDEHSGEATEMVEDEPQTENRD